MGTIPSTTDYDINPKNRICTNPDCDNCPPGYGNWSGQKVGAKCHKCGQKLTKIKGEPYGTPHYAGW